jgi:hypothetical protein
MTKDDVLQALRTVLNQVQTASGLDSPTVGDAAVPSKVLPKFDSTVWPVAAIWLGKALNVDIPNDVHIFGGKDGGRLLTLSETAELVLRKAMPLTAIAYAAE